MLEAESSGSTISSPSGFANNEHSQNVPTFASVVDPSPVQAGSPTEIPSLAPKDALSQSDLNFDQLQDRNPPFALKPLSNAASTEMSQANSAKQTGDFTTAQSFHPPPGSRLLAFARVQPKAVPNVNQAPTLQTLNGMSSFLFKGSLLFLRATIGQGIQPESQGFSKVDSPRPAASFSPFEEQSRQTYDESRDSGIATNLLNLSLRGPVDQMFNPSNNQLEPVYNGLAAAKGSRFAKFFDGKARDTQSQSNKSQVPVGYISPSPNHHQRQEQSNLSNLASNPGDQRTMDDIFAMLNSSSQVGIRFADTISLLTYSVSSVEILPIIQLQVSSYPTTVLVHKDQICIYSSNSIFNNSNSIAMAVWNLYMRVAWMIAVLFLMVWYQVSDQFLHRLQEVVIILDTSLSNLKMDRIITCSE
jgi:hypothetical protein